LNPDYILKGAVHSFHSAWSFLRDAVLLYRNSRYSGSCVLGTIAGEHLGQCQFLLGAWEHSLKQSSKGDCKKFQKDLARDHEQVLKDGMVALQYACPPRLAELGFRLSGLKPEDPDYRAVADEWTKGHEKIRRKAPSKFYNMRINAQYVKPTPDCQRWHSPMNVSPAEVHDLLLNIGNSYRTFLFFFFLKDPRLLNEISELGIRGDLEDVRSTWPMPPPGADAVEKLHAT
jgi:AbiV family abortive infection protein